MLEELGEESVSASEALCQHAYQDSMVNGEIVLSRKPAPKLERLFADPPPPRQIREFAQVAVVVRERERVLVVVQVQLAYLVARR